MEFSILQVLGSVFLPLAATVAVSEPADLLVLLRAFLFPDLGFRPRFFPTFGAGVADVVVEFSGGVEVEASAGSAISPLAELSKPSRVKDDDRLCLAADPICVRW